MRHIVVAHIGEVLASYYYRLTWLNNNTSFLPFGDRFCQQQWGRSMEEHLISCQLYARDQWLNQVFLVGSPCWFCSFQGYWYSGMAIYHVYKDFAETFRTNHRKAFYVWQLFWKSLTCMQITYLCDKTCFTKIVSKLQNVLSQTRLSESLFSLFTMVWDCCMHLGRSLSCVPRWGIVVCARLLYV